MSDHIRRESCNEQNCGGSCVICCCFVCQNCGLLEGALTTECPGPIGKEYWDKSDKVYAGKLDFRNGEWVSEPNPFNQDMAKYKAKLLYDCHREAMREEQTA